jgi:hypothetical protein
LPLRQQTDQLTLQAQDKSHLLLKHHPYNLSAVADNIGNIRRRSPGQCFTDVTACKTLNRRCCRLDSLLNFPAGAKATFAKGLVIEVLVRLAADVVRRWRLARVGFAPVILRRLQPSAAFLTRIFRGGDRRIQRCWAAVTLRLMPGASRTF